MTFQKNKIIETAVRFCLNFPVFVFVAIAFTITWGFKLLHYKLMIGTQLPAFNVGLIAQYGPSVSAILLIAVTRGRTGLRKIARSLFDWQVNPWWILMAFLFEPLMFLLFTALYWLKFREFPVANGITVINGLATYFLTFIWGIFRWGLSEEIGWRGWMFPWLQKRMSPFNASLIGAVIITLWHLDPLSIPEITDIEEGACLMGRYPPILERLIISIPIVLAITFIYNNTRGSLLVMMIFHSASNTSYFFIDETFGIVQTDFFRTAFLFALIVIAVLFSILVMRQRQKVTSDSLFY